MRLPIAFRRARGTVAAVFIFASAGAALASARDSKNGLVLPAWFEPNRGQLPAEAAFFGRSQGYALLIEKTGIAKIMLPPTNGGDSISLEFPHGAPESVGAEEEGSSVMKLYRGARALESTMASYTRVRCRGIYPGIDLVWVAAGPAFRYEFQLQPQADPRAIRLRFGGIRSLHLSSDGDLIADTAHGQLRYSRPVAFQGKGNSRVSVDISYEIRGSEALFRPDAYNTHQPLIIDPLITSTYLGGSGFDAVNGIATDQAGNIYVAGETASLDFPVAKAPSSLLRSAFVAELSPDMSNTRYVTILSGSGNSRAAAVTVDSAGNAYVGGSAGGADFPLTSGALMTSVYSVPTGFVAKIGAGGRLLYSTYLGHDNTAVNSLSLDSLTNVYVAGSTGSVSFPTTAGAPQRTLAGATDGFVAKLNLNSPALIYSTLVGGLGFDSLAGVVVTRTGSACVAGTAGSGLTTHNALQSSFGGAEDAVIGCLNPAGTSWIFLTYWGGASQDLASAIAMDANENLVVAGTTMSQNFPITTAVAAPHDYDAFVTKLHSDGSGIIFSTLLGGGGSDSATSVVCDGVGQIWVAGYTSSIDFPQRQSVQAAFGGGFDGFVGELSSDGRTILVSTYIGGAGDDRILAAAMNESGSVVVAGMTSSSNFLTSRQPLQAKFGGTYDGFVTVISSGSTAQAPGVFSNGAWQLDLNGNRSWDGSAIDRQVFLGQPGDIPVVGDWNGDGRAKPGIFRGGLWVLDYNGNGVWDGPQIDRFFYLGQSGDIPIVGDWNGDGRAKAGIFRGGLWVLDYNGSGAWDGPLIDRFFYLGQAGDLPVIGDWNGDGRAKGGIFRSGLWVLDYNGNGVWDGPLNDRFFTIGEQGDTPVVGDWNGDGRSKAGIFRAGLWMLDYNGDGVWEATAADRSFSLGTTVSTPVVGDWNGDGRSKAAAFSSGAWWFDLTGDGSIASAFFGQSSGIPVAGKWQ